VLRGRFELVLIDVDEEKQHAFEPITSPSVRSRRSRYRVSFCAVCRASNRSNSLRKMKMRTARKLRATL
jgi:hypothetical protein